MYNYTPIPVVWQFEAMPRLPSSHPRTLTSAYSISNQLIVNENFPDTLLAKKKQTFMDMEAGPPDSGLY